MFRRTLLAVTALFGLTGGARAADDILIGAVYPLSGNAAAIGHDAQAAMETEAAIINGTAGEKIPGMLLGSGEGLPNLGGAHVKLVWADSQNNPQIARTEAERLITQSHVVAIIGSYTSATAVTISQICDRYQIPYISADNSSPSLNKQGLSWFFRPSPTDVGFTGAMFDFIDWAGQNGHPIKSVAIIHENSVFGTDSGKLQASLAEKAGIKVAADLAYQASTPSLSVEAQRLKAADADLVLPSSYTSDAILMMRSMHDAGYSPKALLAQDAGFIDPAFLKAAGPLANGVMSRSSFALDATSTRPAIGPVNKLYAARNDGKDLNDLTAREVTALEVLADAINRAKSTKNTDLQAALKATDIPGDKTVMPWKGIKFDETGQNTEGNPVIQQWNGSMWHTVFPTDVATAKPVWSVGQ
ncbi:MAG: ABC transporter substrate-binding protein [Acetobacteraceae bacterium]|nr:ABC transporter substrate-binding protein [Acetobacteraceae bacterium]